MSLISLNKISSVTDNIVKINWFKNVGKEIDSSLYSFIKNYCQELNIHNEIKQVATWEGAIRVINSKDWNKECWEIEEKEKENLLADLELIGKKRKIGKVISKRIYEFLFSE